MLTIVDVTPGALTSDVSWWLDEPHPGLTLQGHTFTLTGWAVGSGAPVVSVEVLNKRVVLRSVPIDRPRPDVADVPEFEGIVEAGRSGFRTCIGLLGLPREFVLSIQAVLADGRRVPLGAVRGVRSLLSPAASGSIRPIIVTCLARSGTTLLMELLGGHPEIIVETSYPYETRLATYWMQMLKVMSEPREEVPPVVWFTRFADVDVVHPNPFTELASAGGLEWLRGTYIENLAAFCRSSLDGFYREVGRGQGKSDATCFAEKQFPSALSDLIDELYPERTEVISVRDPRDMLISTFAFMTEGRTVLGHTEFDDPTAVVDSFGAEVNQLLERKRRLGVGAFVMRYEDLVARPAVILKELLMYARLPTSALAAEQIVDRSRHSSARFEQHRTSVDVESSTERWEREFVGPARNHWSHELEVMTVELGYPPTPGFKRSTIPSAPSGSYRASPGTRA